MNIFKNTFINGLLLALSVVATDFLNSYITGQAMSTNALIVAAAIAVVGFAGRYMSGVANTNVAMIGSAMLAIIPLIADGKVDWKLLIATFAVKLIGLATEGAAGKKQPENTTIYKARV